MPGDVDVVEDLLVELLYLFGHYEFALGILESVFRPPYDLEDAVLLPGVVPRLKVSVFERFPGEVLILVVLLEDIGAFDQNLQVAAPPLLKLYAVGRVGLPTVPAALAPRSAHSTHALVSVMPYP